MIPPIVANSNLTTQCTIHLYVLLIWSIFLLPISIAKDLPNLRLFTSLLSLIGLIIWWTSPVRVNSSMNGTFLNIPLNQVHYLPETIYVGIFCTCTFVDRCFFSLGSVFNNKTKWSIVMISGIIFPLISINHMTGSCGGKIVVSYKKGYEVFSEMTDDMCSAHFSYLIVTGVAFVSGIGWHYISETMQFNTFIVRGLENIVMLVTGLLLIVFRSVTVTAFHDATTNAQTSHENPFFGNGEKNLINSFFSMYYSMFI
jgi:hypothetical protein